MESRKIPTHSQRVQQQWENYSPEKRTMVASKISESTKSFYSNAQRIKDAWETKTRRNNNEPMPGSYEGDE